MSERAFLIREPVRAGMSETLGYLTVAGEKFATLERPWIDNVRNISCIPPGRYDCAFLPRSSSGRYRNVFWVKNVPGRGGILVHAGNTVDHTRGCILIGRHHGLLYDRRAVLASRLALRRLTLLLNKKDFTLEVIHV